MDGPQPGMTDPAGPGAEPGAGPAGAADGLAAGAAPSGPGAVPLAAAAAAAAVAPASDAGRDDVPPPRTLPAPRRAGRAARPAVELPRLALPGVSSAEILAELQRRRRRADQLLAERLLVVQEMQAVEAALETLGQ